MRHENTLDLSRTALAVIDLQESFRPHIEDFAGLAERVGRVVWGSRLLGVPVVVTEQYPKGLGHTAGEVLALLPRGCEPIEKTAFSSCGAQAFVSKLEEAGARQILVCGIEAHICVTQTVIDLLARGFEVHLLVDCITSRKRESKEVALARLKQAGAVPSNLEMALFEMMRTADSPQFKAVQSLIK